jgi:hypothetical protein
VHCGSGGTLAPVTGAGTSTIPVYVSPGRSGFAPQLELSYNSGSGNGPFGFGWSVSLPMVTRKTDKGLPQYEDAQESDIFILPGAEINEKPEQNELYDDGAIPRLQVTCIGGSEGGTLVASSSTSGSLSVESGNRPSSCKYFRMRASPTLPWRNSST